MPKGELPEQLKKYHVEKYLAKIALEQGADIEIFDFEAHYDPELTLEENYEIMDTLVYGFEYDKPGYVDIKEQLKEKKETEEDLLKHFQYLEDEMLRAKEELKKRGVIVGIPIANEEVRWKMRELEDKLSETKGKLKKTRRERAVIKKKLEKLREEPIKEIIYKYPPKVPPPPPPSIDEVFNEAIRYLRKARK